MAGVSREIAESVARVDRGAGCRSWIASTTRHVTIKVTDRVVLPPRTAKQHRSCSSCPAALRPLLASARLGPARPFTSRTRHWLSRQDQVSDAPHSPAKQYRRDRGRPVQKLPRARPGKRRCGSIGRLSGLPCDIHATRASSPRDMVAWQPRELRHNDRPCAQRTDRQPEYGIGRGRTIRSPLGVWVRTIRFLHVRPASIAMNLTLRRPLAGRPGRAASPTSPRVHPSINRWHQSMPLMACNHLPWGPESGQSHCVSIAASLGPPAGPTVNASLGARTTCSSCSRVSRRGPGSLACVPVSHSTDREHCCRWDSPWASLVDAAPAQGPCSGWRKVDYTGRRAQEANALKVETPASGRRRRRNEDKNPPQPPGKARDERLQVVLRWRFGSVESWKSLCPRQRQRARGRKGQGEGDDMTGGKKGSSRG